MLARSTSMLHFGALGAMALSNKIRKYRFERGEMLQRELANQVGVSRQTINAVENRKQSPSLELAIKIAHVFQISVNELFELDYDGKPARAQPASRAEPVRSQPAIEQPTEIEGRHEPAEGAADRQPTLADLRNIF